MIQEQTAAQHARDGTAFLAAEPRLRTLVELARARFPTREVWLFGSRARGDDRPGSDWDILILVDDDAPDVALDPVRLWQIGRDAGLVADVVADRVSAVVACSDVPTTIPYEVKREGIRLA